MVGLNKNKMGKLKEIYINNLSLEELDEYLYNKQLREDPTGFENEHGKDKEIQNSSF